jgi:Protein of unknown function (DUF3311)
LRKQGWKVPIGRLSPLALQVKRSPRLGLGIPIDRSKTPYQWRDDRAFADGGETMKLILLLVPCILALWVPFYNSIPPVLFGIPFFFWFQLVLVPISAIAILAADRIGKD